MGVGGGLDRPGGGGGGAVRGMVEVGEEFRPAEGGPDRNDGWLTGDIVLPWGGGRERAELGGLRLGGGGGGLERLVVGDPAGPREGSAGRARPLLGSLFDELVRFTLDFKD